MLIRRAAVMTTLLFLTTPAFAAMLTVTSTADSGAGSLRAQLAAAQPGDTIVFAVALAGDTITLTSSDASSAMDANGNLAFQLQFRSSRA